MRVTVTPREMAADAPQNQASPLHVDPGESREACHSTHTHKLMQQCIPSVDGRVPWPAASSPRALVLRPTGSFAGEPSATLSTPSSSRGVRVGGSRRLSGAYMLSPCSGQLASGETGSLLLLRPRSDLHRYSGHARGMYTWKRSTIQSLGFRESALADVRGRREDTAPWRLDRLGRRRSSAFWARNNGQGEEPLVRL